MARLNFGEDLEHDLDSGTSSKIEEAVDLLLDLRMNILLVKKQDDAIFEARYSALSQYD